MDDQFAHYFPSLQESRLTRDPHRQRESSRPASAASSRHQGESLSELGDPVTAGSWRVFVEARRRLYERRHTEAGTLNFDAYVDVSRRRDT
jgi:hypothetical protein